MIAMQRRRLEKLEARFAVVTKKPSVSLRAVVSCVARPLNLANSSCIRRLGRNGSITEVVLLDGSRSDITDEQLDRFIETFPVWGLT